MAYNTGNAYDLMKEGFDMSNDQPIEFNPTTRAENFAFLSTSLADDLYRIQMGGTSDYDVEQRLLRLEMLVAELVARAG